MPQNDFAMIDSSATKLVLLCLVIFNTVSSDTPVTYDTNVEPIFRQNCFKCHGEDKAKAGINLQSYVSALKGGSGGAVVVAGRSSGSLLYQAITHQNDVTPMPPKRPKIADDQIETIRMWIDQGLLETSKSKSLIVKRDIEFVAATGSKLDGPPPMPETLPEVKLTDVHRPFPVIAMDASPWAPLLAAAGPECVQLYHLESQKPCGVLPFPDGEPHVLRFSHDGALLLAAGGRPVQSGKVVLFDIRTGKRLTEVGDEIDTVLAADLSPDQQQVALGGSSKIVKVYATKNGELLYKMGKHTDWITAIEFSPDGNRIATADRAGAIHLWDAKTGGILLSLTEHKEAVRALHWRPDNRILASGGEDGKLVWWDAKDGWPVKVHNSAHEPERPKGYYGKLRGGVLAVRFAPDGHLITAGRDGKVHYWDAEPGKLLLTFQVPGSLPISVSASSDSKTLIAGDAAGQLHFWKAP
ncbi:MAG: hypothetical protein O3B01_11570 [Planctomycetota bacterium]|nr:hypothetical protein [Planctomycetota bacterium]